LPNNSKNNGKHKNNGNDKYALYVDTA